MAKVILVEVEREGRWYEVRCYDATTGEDVEVYIGGNSSWESAGFVEPESPIAATFEQMKEWAFVTAEEMSKDYDAPVEEEVYVFDAAKDG